MFIPRHALALAGLVALAGVLALSGLSARFAPPAPSPAAAGADQSLQLQSRDAQLAALIAVPEMAPRPLPAVVLVHGSGRVTAGEMLANAGRRLRGMGFAVLAYDKRGVGGSSGEYTSIGPGNSERMFDLLAGDALAGVEALRNRADIDPHRIGLVAFSQAGWIAPLAATRSAQVAFVVSISGPAVTVGEEIAYSRLAGDDPGSIQGLSEEEIDRRMQSFSGPHGYDPLPALRAMRAPSLWILGERDRSIPLKKTVATLNALAAQEGKPITTRVYPGLNHGLRDVVTGDQPDVWRAIESWLRERGVLTGT